MPTCPNATLTEETIVEDPLFGSVKFHHIGLIVSAVFALIAVGIALYLIFQHATHYLRPWEQRHIIRILFMIPIYATVSFLSYLFYKHAIYFEVIRDCYEAFAIASFFTLLCHYTAPNLHDQKEYFRTITVKNWVWPTNWAQKVTGGRDKGPLRVPRSGLTWFNIVWLAVFQYCFIRVFFTVVSCVTEYLGNYCETSNSPVFAHVWVSAFEAIGVTFAMYFLIQFYFQLKTDLAPYKPFLKILCIKLVIFFSFWQNLVIDFLISSGTLKPSKKIAYADMSIGIPSMMLCIEMSVFAVMHIFAFPWKEYDKNRLSDPITAPGGHIGDPEAIQYQGGWMGIKALMDAFNPWDIIKASARGFRWLFVGRRKRTQDKSYNPNFPKLDEDGTSYSGVTFAGSGEPATEMKTTEGRQHSDSSATAYTAPDEEDRAGLLSHAQSQPSTSKFQDYDADARPVPQSIGSSTVDLGARNPPSYQAQGYPPSHGAGRYDESTMYEMPEPGLPHTGSQPPQQGGQQWDMFSGSRHDDPVWRR